MEIIESSCIGDKIISERQAIILGISINNSYFKPAKLAELMLWATKKSSKIYIMIPDKPMVHTLVATGKSLQEAERIARLKANNLANKWELIKKEHGLADVNIVRWGYVEQSKDYWNTLADITRAYHADHEFRDALAKTTTEVLMNNNQEEGVLNLEEGVQFILQELAFITAANRILGQEKTGYVYHKTMKVMKEIFEGKYSFKPDPGTGFLTVV
jgi:cyclo(L-tyrosyl-L-tyrosyl) synthase